MTDFGDIEPDDAFDTAAPDLEQVAIRMHELRSYMAAHRGRVTRQWQHLDDDEREVGVALVDDIIKWLTRQGGIRDG